MTAPQPVPGVYSPTQGQPTGCARCGATLCECPDAVYAGVVTIDRASEPGSWSRHLRDTACMRDHGPALPNSEARP